MATVDDVFEKLVELQGDFREHKGDIVARVAQLEKDNQDDKFWDNVKIVAVIPVVGAIHELGQRIGWWKHQ
jgi:ATP-dependent protease HslVU (ClpYQ) peptidase subunit